jgi:hypothetical protein
MSKARKSKKPRKVSEKRLAESKGQYYRREVDGGCVVLQSAYWLVRAEQPEPT